MVVTFIILWSLTYLMLKYDWQTTSTRWAALITFFGGCGGFARAWLEIFAPYLDTHGLGGVWLDTITLPIYNSGSFLNTVGLPYAFLLFACSYSGKFSTPLLYLTGCLAAIPLPIMLCITPAEWMIAHNYMLLLSWVGPYILTGTGLLVHTYLTEQRAVHKDRHRMILYLSLPPVLFQFVTNYILRALDIHTAWRLNVVTISILLLIYLILAYRRSLFGLQVKFERARIGRTLQSFTSGNTLLQHTIKNETAKILMLSEQLSFTASEQQWAEIRPPIQHIQDSARHLLHMMERLQHHAQGIVLQQERITLQQLIDQTLISAQPYQAAKEIVIQQQLTEGIILICDPIHMREVLHNILLNAIEASSKQGRLLIAASVTNQKFQLAITDWGTGIARQHLKLVYDPFFTTKSLKTNYGLGLTYCHKVIDSHGGTMHISSRENIGTTVQIQWPLSKVWGKNHSVKEHAHEPDQGIAG